MAIAGFNQDVPHLILWEVSAKAQMFAMPLERTLQHLDLHHTDRKSSDSNLYPYKHELFVSFNPNNSHEMCVAGYGALKFISLYAPEVLLPPAIW